MIHILYIHTIHHPKFHHQVWINEGVIIPSVNATCTLSLKEPKREMKEANGQPVKKKSNGLKR